MSLLDEVRSSLHITNNKSDDDIQAEISSAMQLLSIAGVHAIYDDDPLTVSAIKAYCKGVFNFQGEGEQWLARFERIRTLMPLAKEYRGECNGE